MALLPGEVPLAERMRMGRGCCGLAPIHIVMMTDRRMVLKFEHGLWCISEGSESSIMYRCVMPDYVAAFREHSHSRCTCRSMHACGGWKRGGHVMYVARDRHKRALCAESMALGSMALGAAMIMELPLRC
jgi:hypothetical protein